MMMMMMMMDPPHPRRILRGRSVRAGVLRGVAAGCGQLDDKDNWAGYIRKLLTLYGGPEGAAMWEKQGRLWSGTRIREVVEAECDRLHGFELLEVQRLAFLRTSHGSGFGVSAALQVSVEVHRRPLRRLLCSGHPLAIEAGRHTNTPRDRRHCLQDVNRACLSITSGDHGPPERSNRGSR